MEFNVIVDKYRLAHFQMGKIAELGRRALFA